MLWKVEGFPKTQASLGSSSRDGKHRPLLWDKGIPQRRVTISTGKNKKNEEKIEKKSKTNSRERKHKKGKR